MSAVAATDLVRLRVAAGAPVGTDLGLAPRVARAVAVADAVGAGVLAALDAAAAAEDDADRARRAVVVASAQARVVAAGLVLAPAVLVPGLGRLLGTDLAAYFTSAGGRVVLASGSALLAAGAATVLATIRRVDRAADAPPPARLGVHDRSVVVAATVVALVVTPALTVPAALVTAAALRRRQRLEVEPDLEEAADLLATALSGSVGTTAALRLVADALPSSAAPLRRLALAIDLGIVRTSDPHAADGPAGDPSRAPVATGVAGRRLAAVLVTAGVVGADPTTALRRLATDLRAERLARTLAAAERLPAQLTFPTTLLLLPATVLLVGAPVVATGLDVAFR